LENEQETVNIPENNCTAESENESIHECENECNNYLCIQNVVLIFVILYCIFTMGIIALSVFH